MARPESKKQEAVNLALECAFELARQVSLACQGGTATADDKPPTSQRMCFDKCTVLALPDNVLHDGIVKLKAAVQNIRLDNVSFRTGPYIDATNSLPGRAPFMTIPVLEAPWGTTTIFLLRGGSHLPLHDHPDMIGIIKVLRGALTIHSYDSSEETVAESVDDPTSNQIKDAENLEKLKQGVEFEERQSPAGAAVRIASDQLPTARIIRVRKMATKVLKPDDEPIVLYPKHGDVHEIYGSYDTPTVFFDILLPPYHTSMASNERVKRNCHYYRRIDTIPVSAFPDKNIADCAGRDPALHNAAREINIDPARTQSDAEDVSRAYAGKTSAKRIERDGEWLNVQEIPTPSWFFSTSMEYDGPKLEGSFLI